MVKWVGVENFDVIWSGSFADEIGFKWNTFLFEWVLNDAKERIIGEELFALCK